eukprot:Nk52_evm52s1992 gene=Nk52_evmTU52s1992
MVVCMGDQGGRGRPYAAMIIDGAYFLRGSTNMTPRGTVDFVKLRMVVEHLCDGNPHSMNLKEQYVKDVWFIDSFDGSQSSYGLFLSLTLPMSEGGPNFKVMKHGYKNARIRCPHEFCNHSFNSTVQAGVDVGIATKIMEYGIDRDCEKIILVAGDGDFSYPLEVASNRFNTEIWVAGYHNKTLALDLVSCSDRVIWINDIWPLINTKSSEDVLKVWMETGAMGGDSEISDSELSSVDYETEEEAPNSATVGDEQKQRGDVDIIESVIVHETDIISHSVDAVEEMLHTKMHVKEEDEEREKVAEEEHQEEDQGEKVLGRPKKIEEVCAMKKEEPKKRLGLLAKHPGLLKQLCSSSSADDRQRREEREWGTVKEISHERRPKPHKPLYKDNEDNGDDEGNDPSSSQGLLFSVMDRELEDSCYMDSRKQQSLPPYFGIDWD